MGLRAIINLGHTDPPIKIRRCWLITFQPTLALGQWICIRGQLKEANLKMEKARDLKGLARSVAAVVM